MNRFFCGQSDIAGDKIIIRDREQLHHIRNVLRLKPGKPVEVFDEKGNEYNCEIREIKDEVCLDIKNKIPADKASRKIKLTVAIAIPKKSKLDDIIDKLVQLGVERVIPLKTERVIVKLDKYKETERLQRWKKIALSASKQCKRNSLAIIEPVTGFPEVIAQSSGFDLKLIPYLEGERQGLKDVLDRFVPADIIVLIGPEGDFSEKEVSLARDAGFIPVTLGDLVLRVDTAAIAVAGFIKLYAHR